MVESYRLTRTPGVIQSPTSTPTTGDEPAPTATASATATTVSGPAIYLVPEVIEPGNPVEVRGTNWQPDETVALSIGAEIESAQLTGTNGAVRGDGTFAATVNVPATWSSDNAVIIAESIDAQRRAVARLYLLNPTVTAPPTTIPSLTPTPMPAPSATPTPAFRRWRGAYYDNSSLQDQPLLVRDDNLIDFAWGEGAPADIVPADDFSVRWTRQVDFLAGGYRFEVTADDGVRVFLDDQLVLDEWEITSTTSYEFQRVLDGLTDVRVEYFDAGGNATIRFQWQYLGRYPNWRGAYYDNRTLSGSPVVVRDDIAVDFDWGGDSPAPQVPPDNFSARWTRTATVDAGTHRFHARADDGVRVWVDDRLIIDEWHISTGDTAYSGDVYLSRGDHDVEVEYYEAGGGAKVSVWWENLDAYPDWHAAYFDNRTLTGPPAYVRNDLDIDFNWGTESPDDVGPDDFSIQWTDRRDFFESGVYRFHAQHDDGVRVWVDGQLIIDEWYETGPVTDQADVSLTAGRHDLRVDYFEASGGASIRVWWEMRPIQ